MTGARIVLSENTMSLVGLRGMTPLTDEVALRAHLATLLRLENVGLFLGAGASCPAGGKTIKQLWQNFVAKSEREAKWLVEQKMVAETALLESDRQVIPNIEDVIDTLEIALTEWRRVGDSKTGVGTKVRAELFRAAVRAALLEESWWTSPEGADADVEKLTSHRAILQKVVAARQPGQASPWVFTTNYDLGLEWAAESINLQVVNGFVGVHSRHFSPQCFDLGFRNTQARGEARFGVYNIYLAKLHGSLTWKEHNKQLFEVPAPLAWGGLKSFLDGGTDEILFLVLPRAAKYIQTVGFTVGELLRRFSEFLARPQTSLITCGYAFEDEHINRLLQSAILNPTLQLVIYLPEFKGDSEDIALPVAIRRLLALKNPRVTIIGGGDQAWLDKLAAHLPDPILYDEDTRQLEKAMREQSGVDGSKQ